MWSEYKIAPSGLTHVLKTARFLYLEALKHAGVYRMSFGLESENEELFKTHLKNTYQIKCMKNILSISTRAIFSLFS